MLPLHGLLRIARYAWASPYTALGLLLGGVAMLCGAVVRVQDGALEFGGGRLGGLLARLPARCRFCAITLGHVILGTDPPTLDAVRAHEQVHVRQYERWGVLFGPAYLLSSLLQLLRGRRPYLDNHYERQACSQAERSGTAAQRIAAADAPKH